LGQPKWCRSLSWSRSGFIAWADVASGLQVWDDRAGRPITFGKGVDSARSLAFRPDGARLAVAGFSSMTVVDVAKRRVVASLNTTVSAGNGVAFSADGSRLAFATSSTDFGIFDSHLRLLEQIGPLEPNTRVEHAASARMADGSPLDSAVPARLYASGRRSTPAPPLRSARAT
jgi:WD40 repeat protein